MTEIVLENMRQVPGFASNYEREFARMVMEQVEAEQKRDIAEKTRLGDVDKFLAVVRKYTEIQELNLTIANEFIDRIIVHEPEKAREKNECHAAAS